MEANERDKDSYSADQEEFLKALGAKSNGYSGNIALLSALKKAHGEKWDTDRWYWKIRNSLIDAGKITRGRGRGGSVQIVDDSTLPVSGEDVGGNQSSDTGNTASAYATNEGDNSKSKVNEAYYYGPFKKTLEELWIQDERYLNSIVLDIHAQGRRQTGKWSRPDLLIVGVAAFPLVPGRSFSVVTFELKTIESADISAVYEALSHKKSATQSYLVVAYEGPLDSENDSKLKLLAEEARSHGIGLMTFSKGDDSEADSTPNAEWTYETLVDARRSEPAPWKLSEFLSLQLPDNAKKMVELWIR